jgi:hypothetical protein
LALKFWRGCNFSLEFDLKLQNESVFEENVIDSVSVTMELKFIFHHPIVNVKMPCGQRQ